MDYTVIDPKNTVIDADARIGKNTIIEPFCGCRPNSFAFRFFRIPMFCQFLTGFGGHFTVSAACLCSSCTKVCSSGRRVPLSG